MRVDTGAVKRSAVPLISYVLEKRLHPANPLARSAAICRVAGCPPAPIPAGWPFSSTSVQVPVCSALTLPPAATSMLRWQAGSAINAAAAIRIPIRFPVIESLLVQVLRASRSHRPTRLGRSGSRDLRRGHDLADVALGVLGGVEEEAD